MQTYVRVYASAITKKLSYISLCSCLLEANKRFSTFTSELQITRKNLISFALTGNSGLMPKLPCSGLPVNLISFALTGNSGLMPKLPRSGLPVKA